jgi:hypothetical protein
MPQNILFTTYHFCSKYSVQTVRPMLRLFLSIILVLLYLSFVGSYTFTYAQQSALQQPDKATQEIKRLESIWADWFSKEKSIEVEGYRFIGVASHINGKLSRDNVLKIINKGLIPLVSKTSGEISFDALDSTTNQIFQKSKSQVGQPYGNWRKFTFLEHSGAVRLDEDFTGRVFTAIRSDGIEVQYGSGSSQASFYGTHSGLRIPKNKTFLFKGHVPNTGLQHWLLDKSDPQKSHLHMFEFPKTKTGRSILCDYNSTNGFVHYFAMKMTKDNFFTERFQNQNAEASSKIPFPRFFAEINYTRPKDGSLAKPFMVSIYVINHIVINGDYEPDRFKLRVPKGVNVVKFSQGMNHLPPSRGGSRPQMEKTTSVVEDVAAFSQRAEFGSRKKPARK